MRKKLFGDVPVIFGGDFNAEPDSEEMKPLKETDGLVNATEESVLHSTISTETIRTIRSARLIILFSKGTGELKKVEKWTEQKDGVCLSDHYPICAELI